MGHVPLPVVGRVDVDLWPLGLGQAGWAETDSGARGADHEHAVLGAEDFVVEIDTDDGIGSPVAGFGFHFSDRGAAGITEDLFVGAGAASDDVTNSGKEITKDIGTNDGFTGDDAEVFLDGAAFDGGGGGADHVGLRVELLGKLCEVYFSGGIIVVGLRRSG